MMKKAQIQIGDTVVRRKDGVQCRICKLGNLSTRSARWFLKPTRWWI